MVVADARTDSDDFAFSRLFLGGIGNDDAALGLFFGLDALDSLKARPYLQLASTRQRGVLTKSTRVLRGSANVI